MRIKNERGQSLVELAISLTVLLFLLSGAAEFGVIFFKYVQLRDAAQEGALYASLYPLDTTGIKQRIQNSSNSPINLANDNEDTGGRSIIIFPTDPCVGEAVEVQVIHRHKVFMPFMSKFVGNGTGRFQLKATVTDTILQTTDPSCP